MFLDVDLVEHHVFLLGVDVGLHLHCNVSWQHGQQQTLLEGADTQIVSLTVLLFMRRQTALNQEVTAEYEYVLRSLLFHLCTCAAMFLTVETTT